jgi:hypothetical protein
MSKLRSAVWFVLAGLLGLACSAGLDVGRVLPKPIPVEPATDGGVDVMVVPPDSGGMEPARLVLGADVLRFTPPDAGPGPRVTIVVANRGQQASGPISATIGGSDSASFSIASSTCDGSLAAAAQCELGIEFQADGPGDKSAFLAVAATPGGIATARLQGSGPANTADGARLTVSPPALTFKTVDVGHGTDARFVISNVGGVATTDALTISIAGPNAVEFIIGANNCMGPLGAGASCSIEIGFQPKAPGTKTAALLVVADGRAVTAPLSGTGSAAVFISPRGKDFANSFIGDFIEAGFMVKNPTATMVTPVIGLSSTNSQSFKVFSECSQPLAAGLTCKVVVQFVPTALGPHDAVLTATLGAAQDEVPLRASVAEAVGLKVTPVDAVVPVGGSQQFSATLTTADGATHDVTQSSQTTWTSSEPTLVTIGNTAGTQGLATVTVAGGGSVIRASFRGLAGSAMLTISK